ncbi:unnamed protein product [Moneuplotes crassus]|uniref:FGFR1 oncogene partner (FOP) N-terminal dimerisation domain-containing protein n=1 Tax=Euplotes crassus TaxID=5936 RepID=A0AAD1XUT5_EUPCR|nr:unnamed protein product [Moneuplotes crassus]
MDELKNLVIQTLETNGILGEIRAKLRSSVFKVIDSNDPAHKEKAMHWENSLAQKVLETTESALAADLIREYLEFYRLDYTLSIMIPEANLKQDPLDREQLVRKAEVDQATDKEPLLVQILKERKHGGARAPASMVKKDPPSTAHMEPSSGQSPGLKNKYSHNTEDRKESQRSNTKKNSEPNEYNDSFEDDDIEENLPVEDIEEPGLDDGGNGFTASQSLGMDPSVNTLAMDEYDHVEEVFRLG